jgi:hypothetical protein
MASILPYAVVPYAVVPYVVVPSVVVCYRGTYLERLPPPYGHIGLVLGGGARSQYLQARCRSIHWWSEQLEEARHTLHAAVIKLCCNKTFLSARREIEYSRLFSPRRRT